MDTEPPKTGGVPSWVLNVADGLAGDAKCVAVSVLRCVKVYDVLGVNPVNAGEA